eukprot:4053302-Pleurochrysis_carterae.AAC.3
MLKEAQGTGMPMTLPVCSDYNDQCADCVKREAISVSDVSRVVHCTQSSADAITHWHAPSRR